jgi:hypothetical protein
LLAEVYVKAKTKVNIRRTAFIQPRKTARGVVTASASSGNFGNVLADHVNTVAQLSYRIRLI